MNRHRTIVLALCAANVLQLPTLAFAIRDNIMAWPERVSSQECVPCSSSSGTLSLSKRELHEKLKQGGMNVPRPLGPSTPVCQEVICNAQPVDYTWTVCIRTQSLPLRCQYFFHPYKVWFCPGHTWYKCTGSWSLPDGDCTPCSQSTSDTLPAGCTPPVPSGWEQCV